jgi:hypothetical protein
MQEEIDSIREN